MGDEITGKRLYCSFCGKTQYEVSNLIVGPSVFICDECVVLCVGIINKKRREHHQQLIEPVEELSFYDV